MSRRRHILGKQALLPSNRVPLPWTLLCKDLVARVLNVTRQLSELSVRRAGSSAPGPQPKELLLGFPSLITSPQRGYR